MHNLNHLSCMKLKAKIIKINELIMTMGQRPYAWILLIWASPGCARANPYLHTRQSPAGLFYLLLYAYASSAMSAMPFLFSVPSMAPMSSAHGKMKQYVSNEEYVA